MSLGIHFDVANKIIEIEKLEKLTLESDFWKDTQKASEISTKIKNLKKQVQDYEDAIAKLDDFEELIEISMLEDEKEQVVILEEIYKELNILMKKLDDFQTMTLLSGEYDENNAVLKLNAGAGGTESCDWCDMLFRMYKMWAQKRGFSLNVLDFLDGDEAGLKSITFEVVGQYAYGYLKSEHGVHRLVRISPFNAAGKRQTSFVSCDVMPQIDDKIDLEINEDDLRIDYYRASGAGGQHVNKTSSAVRITHIPSNIVVQCQNERSQIQNREKAMQMLKTKLYLKEKQEQENMIAQIRGTVSDIGWGNQIRSYVLQPYTMVKDHRTNCEVGNAQAVLDGEVDKFMNEYLKFLARRNND